ncbi:TetR/AcrR family transcriptional regulator [soil metagenome]
MTIKFPSTSPTVNKIRDAAVYHFSRQGYRETSLREIAETVGVQVGSLYNHISSKEDLLFTIMHDIMLELLASCREAMEAASPEPGEQILAFMQSSIGFHGERTEETFIGNTNLRALSPERRAVIVALRDEYELLLRTPLERAHNAGALTIPDVQMATFAGVALCSHVATWYSSGQRLILEEVQRLLPMAFAPVAQHLLASGKATP